MSRKAFSVVRVSFNCLDVYHSARLVRGYGSANLPGQIIPIIVDNLRGNWDHEYMIVQPTKFLFQLLYFFLILNNSLHFLFVIFWRFDELGQLEVTSATLKISSKPPMAAFKGGPASGTPPTTGAAMVRTVLTPSCTWRLQESSREGPAAVIRGDRRASAAMCEEPIVNMDSEFERAVVIFELEFL